MIIRVEDIYKQTVAVIVSQEKDLRKKGRVNEFNKVFNDIEDHSTFKELTANELNN